ncbi:hypothetical protein HanRHA438_Chr10g0442501 [Helianthus annuus]|nr:hypothetical protein HanRHA438_Chr15g0716221 [Helianthus annuus]KAJ0878679.1 hypothetical protein HanRHA438_Chr10g0442501 [Helianthus annuus]
MDKRQLMDALVKTGREKNTRQNKEVKAAWYRKLRYYRNLRWPIFSFMLHRNSVSPHRNNLMSTVNYGGAVIYGGA